MLVHRRGLAALCAAVAVGTVLHAYARSPDPGVGVWVARSDLASGSVLRTADLRRTTYARGTRPAHAVTDLDRLVGRTLGLPLGRGDPVTSRHLLGRDLLRSLTGRSAIAVRLPDAAVAGLLRAGDRIDLLTSDPRAGTGNHQVARGAVVLAVPAQEEGSRTDGRLILLAVQEAEVEPVALAASSGFVTVVWSSPG